jgi:hypothetical protein
MNWIEAISVAAGLLAFFQAGYFVGRQSERKKSRFAVSSSSADLLHHVLGSVSITKLDCEPHTVAHGQTISMIFTIASEVKFHYQVWLGASAIDVHGQEYWNAKEDREVTLEKGEQICHRKLTIPTGVSTGNHRLIGTVWLGQKGHVERSIQIARFERADILTIK